MQLDVFSDVACPWCFIGKRRLDRALALMAPAERPTVRFRAFQLDATLPSSAKIPSIEYLTKKFGGEERMRQLTGHVAEVAKTVDITMDFTRQIQVNTRAAHRAIAIARAAGRELDVVDAVFSAHFERGVDVGDDDALAAILAAHGVADGGARLRAGGGDDDVTADLALAKEVGVRGVPFFVLDNRLALSGSQEPEVFVSFLREGAA